MLNKSVQVYYNLKLCRDSMQKFYHSFQKLMHFSFQILIPEVAR